MMMVRTSKTHPLQIGSIDVPGTPGRIGLTFCPGKQQSRAMTGVWSRNLHLDLSTIREWGASALVTLITPREFAELKVEALPDLVHQYQLEWFHLPIIDGGIPDKGFENDWQRSGNKLCELVKHGKGVVIHCKGGLGRAGTVGAKLLVEYFGIAPHDAIELLRDVRPGAIENAEQENYVLRLNQT